MRGFRNEFDKFNNTGARMLDSIYHMTLILLKNRILAKLLHVLTFLNTYNITSCRGRCNVTSGKPCYM